MLCKRNEQNRTQTRRNETRKTCFSSNGLGGRRCSPFRIFDNLKNLCYNKYIEKNMKGENPMLKINLNELSALEFVLNYISVKDLLTFATLGFAESNTERNQDNADICTKSLQVFLR